MYEYLKKLFKEVDGQPEAITAEELIKRIQADKNLNIVLERRRLCFKG